MSELEQHIRRYLKEATVMQLATSLEQRPWCCTVYYVADDAFNLYWISAKDRRHSQELVRNPRVAGVILDARFSDPQHTQRGIQFEGVASVLEGDELAQARQRYIERFGKSADYHEAALTDPDAPSTWYRIAPKEIVLFDKEHYPDDPRQVFSCA